MRESQSTITVGTHDNGHIMAKNQEKKNSTIKAIHQKTLTSSQCRKCPLSTRKNGWERGIIGNFHKMLDYFFCVNLIFLTYFFSVLLRWQFNKLKTSSWNLGTQFHNLVLAIILFSLANVKLRLEWLKKGSKEMGTWKLLLEV